MKSITVSDTNVGELVIVCNKEISPANEFLIKSMAGIQMLCLKRNCDEDPKLKDLIEILESSMERIHNLYDEGDSDDADPFIDYNS